METDIHFVNHISLISSQDKTRFRQKL